MEIKAVTVSAWETTGPEHQKVISRDSVVQSVLAGILAAQLAPAEYLAVVAGIHALMATGNQTQVVVTATSLPLVGSISSWTVEKPCLAPGLVAETVDLLVREASPALWAEIRDVLEDLQAFPDSGYPTEGTGDE